MRTAPTPNSVSVPSAMLDGSVATAVPVALSTTSITPGTTVPTRGSSHHPLRATARRLASEPPGQLFSLSGSARRPTLRAEITVDDAEQLIGLTADERWHGVGVVLPGHTDGRDATIALVVDRRRRSSTAIAVDGSIVGVDSTSGASGFLVDLVHRVLGLPTDPEPTSPTELVLRVWLQNLLDAGADPAGTQGVARWSDAVALHPAWRAGGDPPPVGGREVTGTPDGVAELTLGLGRVLTWERMRRLAADGTIVVPGLAASEAAWMDGPFFARWTLDVHRPVTELLDDLSLFVDGGVLRDVRYTVDAVGWLGFADSHAS